MWEYLTLRRITPLPNEDLNHYGMEGWELVAVYKDKQTELITSDVEAEVPCLVYHFKRKRKNE